MTSVGGRPRVLVISGAYPPMKCGEADHAMHLCANLAACGADVELLTTRRSDAVRDGSALGWRIRDDMDGWGWSEVGRLWRCLRTGRYDGTLLLFPAQYNDEPMISFAATMAKHARPAMRFVTMFEYVWGTSGRTRLSRWGSRAASWFAGAGADGQFGTLLRDSDRLLVLSDQHADLLAARGPGIREKAVLVPPPPLLRMAEGHAAAARQRGRAKLGLTDDAILIVYFGRVYPKKGIENLLEALGMLASRGLMGNAQALLIGGPLADNDADSREFRRRLEMKIVELGAGESRKIPGRSGIKVEQTGEFAHDSDMASLYLHAADLCVLPFVDGVYLNNSSFAAAAAHGLPIVTTRGGRLEKPFVDGENVCLCRPRDSEDLARAMESLLRDPTLRTRLGAGARRLAAEWFEWRGASEKVLKAVLGENGAEACRADSGRTGPDCSYTPDAGLDGHAFGA